MRPTFFRSPHPSIFPAELVARRNQHLREPLLLPRRENADACEVVVVPAQLLLREESNYLPACGLRVSTAQRVGDVWFRVLEHKEVVQEGRDVEEDGFDVEEELREEGEVLRVQLVICAVKLVDRDVVVRVYAPSRHRLGA